MDEPERCYLGRQFKGKSRMVIFVFRTAKNYIAIEAMRLDGYFFSLHI
jgi:hypothetical protein